jgi:hypothetical protein
MVANFSRPAARRVSVTSAICAGRPFVLRGELAIGDGRETQSVLVATAKASAPGVSVTWLSFAMRKCLGHRPNEFGRPGPSCDPLALHSVNVSQRTARHLQMCNRFRLRGPIYRRIGGYVGCGAHLLFVRRRSLVARAIHFSTHLL